MTQRTDQPLIVMAMGDAGSFTRLESFTHGSQLTFAQTGIASAPGQLSVDEVLRYYTV
jgi:3-dehydroquinate dehydratase-1